MVAGLRGKFPSGNVIKIDLPPHSSDVEVLVAIADYSPAIKDDIPLRRGK